MNGACNSTYFCPRGETSKGQISLNFNYKVNFKDSYTKTLCVFSQIKDIKHTKQGFSFCRLGHTPGVGLGGSKI